MAYGLTSSPCFLTASGYYIYIETSSPRQPNDKARIMSAPIAPDGRMGHCVKFWFHMYGPHVDSLNVYKKVGQNLVLVWKRSGNNGNAWRAGQVDVNSNIRYQVSVAYDLYILLLSFDSRWFIMLCLSINISNDKRMRFVKLMVHYCEKNAYIESTCRSPRFRSLFFLIFLSFFCDIKIFQGKLFSFHSKICVYIYTHILYIYLYSSVYLFVYIP